MSNKVNQELVTKAVEQIDRERLVKLVMDLVDIPSPTGFEGNIARAVHEVQKEANFDSVLQPIGDERYNAVGRLQGAGGGKSLMFNGHLDTSFGPEQAHRGIGYECKGTLIDDEWIYGMGSFNMKSAMGTYIVAAESIQKAGIKLGGDVVIAAITSCTNTSGIWCWHKIRHHSRCNCRLLYSWRTHQHDADSTSLR